MLCSIAHEHTLPNPSMPRILYMDCAPFLGGAQESLWTLAQAFREHAFLVAGNGLQAKALENGWPHAVLPTRHWPATLRGLWQFWQDRRKAIPVLQEAISRFKPELLHANGLRSAMLLAGVRKLPCPVILHDRDIREPSLLLAPLTRRLAPTVVATSSSVAQKWQGRLPKERIHVIPNGFDLTSIRTTIPATLPHEKSPGGWTVLLAGDFLPWKRHGLFLEAVRLAHRQAPELRAIIKGRVRNQEGRVLQQLRQRLAEEPELASCVFIDSTDASALPYIASANLLVSCSQGEPFGRTIVESYALGKPVAATRDGGAPELLDTTAAQVCDSTPDALATAILAWRDVHRRTAAASVALAKAEDYALERTLADWRKLYASLCPSPDIALKP